MVVVILMVRFNILTSGNYNKLMKFSLMKSFIFLGGIFLLFIGCNNIKKVEASKNNKQITCLHEGNWVFNFKNEVFISCLKKMYPKGFRNFYDTADASSSANIDRLQYNLEVRKAINSVAEEFMRKPEANWKIEGGKITMNVCLDFRLSHELDSIAMKYYSLFYKE